MSQVDVSVHATVLPGPRSSLQSDELLHVPTDAEPAFSSHFAEALQVIWLLSPPSPLHSEVSRQSTMVAPEPAALHLDPVWQTTVQRAGPHVVLQSAPAVHVQALLPPHVQSAPEQFAVGGAESSPPHEKSARTPTAMMLNSAR
jgi:hypothetical protein